MQEFVIVSDLHHNYFNTSVISNKKISMHLEHWSYLLISCNLVMVLYRKMSSQISASSMCLLEMFKCKFIILFYYNGAQRNLKITYNNKRPHYRDFYTIAQVSSITIEQICKRTRSTRAVKLSYFLVIFKEIIVAFTT